LRLILSLGWGCGADDRNGFREWRDRRVQMNTQFGLQVRIRQDPGELAKHAFARDPVEAARLQGESQWRHIGVVKEPQVKHHIGVDDDQGSLSRILGRAQASGPACFAPVLLPLTMSNLNMRHSIGPFHNGTRRLSLSRI